MANTKISAFTSGAPAQSTDEFVIARAGANYKLAGSDIKTLAVGAGAVSVTSAKTLSVSNSLTLAGTDGTTMTFPSTSATIARTDAANTFVGTQTLTGNLIFSADNTYDIGGSGVNRPRTLLLSGDLYVQSNLGGIYLGSSSDLALLRDTANILALRRASNPQTFRVYNTYSSTTNYERGAFTWDTNVFKIGTEKGSGGGTARSMELQTDGITALTLTTAQKAEFAQTIKTSAPVGGTAAEWKLGTVASVSPTAPDRTIEVEIGGTIYYVHAKTTNN